MEIKLHLASMALCTAICLGAVWLKRQIERRHDWNESDDWFDQDEHDMSHLEDQEED